MDEEVDDFDIEHYVDEDDRDYDYGFELDDDGLPLDPTMYEGNHL